MTLPLAILSFVLSANVFAADTRVGDGLSYEDLKRLNVSCYPKDTCAGREPDQSPGVTFTSCSCHSECSGIGTCCIDSPHRGESPTNQKCGAVDFPRTMFKASGYHMVHSCPEDDSAWKHLCEGGLDKEGDVLRIAPVTSLDTDTTYRNYYCFRCNEPTDNFRQWNLDLLLGSRVEVSDADDFKVTYDDVDNNWSAAVVDKNTSYGVRLRFLVPPGVRSAPVECNPKVITDCPDTWEDDVIRRECDSYTALVYVSFFSVYKNAHCALCNSQPLDQLSCVAGKNPFVQKSFSFSMLIDVNRYDADEAGKKGKCSEGEKWDPYGKKCRKLSCALPGYVIKDGKCTAP